MNEIPSYTIPKKVYNPLLNTDKIFAALTLVICFVVVNFVFFSMELALGFTISYFLLFGVTTAYLIKGNKPTLFTILAGALSLVGSVTFAIYNDYLINLFMLILVLFLYACYCVSLTSRTNFGSYRVMADLWKAVVSRPFKAMPTILGSVKAGTKKSKKSLSALVGVLVAIPFLCAIIPLLVKSDAAFEGLVSNTVAQIGKYVAQLIVAFIFFPYGFSYLFSQRNKLNNDEISSKRNGRILPYSACVSFLCVISLTYVLYLFSQLAYFFSAFSNLLPAGYKNTASEFARRGFYEMFSVCAINIAIIGAISIFGRKNKKGMALKLLSLFISLFSTLLVVIAMQKMRMNIGIYGLSKNRILVYAFMIMMLVVIGFFILHIFAPRVPYMQGIIIACSVIFIALSFSNIDGKVAEYNIKAYEDGAIQSLDLETIANLSDSAVPYLVKLAEDENEEAEMLIQNMIAFAYMDEFKLTNNTLGYEPNKDFRKQNYSHILALEDIWSYYLHLDDNEAKAFVDDTKTIRYGTP